MTHFHTIGLPQIRRNSTDDEDALVTHQQPTCDPDFSKLCVTPLKSNSSQHSWEEFQHCLWGACSSNIKGQIDQLELELRQQLLDIEQLTEQEVFQTLYNNLEWLNPKPWSKGLNLCVWVMGAMGCLLIIVLFCALKCMYKLLSWDCIIDCPETLALC